MDLGEKQDDEPEKVEKDHDLRPLDTGRSISEIPEESMIQTERSETADLPTDHSSLLKIRTESIALEDNEEESERSEKSEIEKSEKSERTYSYSTGSRTKSYTEDFSDSESSDDSRTESSLSHTADSATQLASSKSVISEKSEPKKDKKSEPVTLSRVSRDIDDIISDISEHFSGGSPGDSDSETGFKLDLNKQSDITEPLSEFNIGDRVLVGGVRAGTLKFKGTTKFASGYWGGVELDTADGTNNGSKDGETYFSCREHYGIFAPPEKLQPLPENWRPPRREQKSSDDEESTHVKSSSKDADTTAKSEDESELEKAIKFAEKSIGDLIDGEKEESTIKSDISPREDSVRSTEDKDRLVERITDDLTLKVVQDSMQVWFDVNMLLVLYPMDPRILICTYFFMFRPSYICKSY